MRPYDICIITAVNSRQAEGYRKQLKWRKEQGLLPDETEFLVYPDPQGKRIGSGGSTIYVLCKLLEDHGYSLDQNNDFYERKRILVLHSGGDSRRLPAYSAVGKIFTPLPTEKFTALFDVLLHNFMQLPLLDDGQVIVTSGDVLLSFEPDYVAFSDTGVTGVAYPDSPDVASNHGVYVVLPNHSEGNPRKVIDFLQKPDLEELQAANALDHAERAFVDTGIMNFALDAVETLIRASTVERAASSLYEQIINAEVQLDLYREFTFAMLGKFVAQDSILAIEQFQEIPFSVNLLPYCDFFHIGKSKEFLQNFHTITHASALYDFRNFTRSNIKEHPHQPPTLVGGDAFVYNTLIDTNSVNLTPPVFIEGCHLNSEIELEGENILTGIPKDVGSIKLKKGICLTCIPVYNPLNPFKESVDSGWTSIIYGIEDSFKYAIEDDECRFLNTNFSDWMKDKGISPTDLWEDNEQHELWNARLFPVSNEPAEAIRLSLALQKATHDFVLAQNPTHDFVLAQNEPGNSTNPHSISQWKAAPRASLRAILNAIDYDRLLESYFEIEQKTKLRNITRTLTPDNDLSSEKIISWCHDKEDYVTLTESVKSLIEGSDDLLFQARLYKLLSNIPRETNGEKIELSDNSVGWESRGFPFLRAGKSGLPKEGATKEKGDIGEDKKALENKAFELIGEAIGRGIHHDELSAQKIQIRSDEVVWVCAPARLDFAGGWSDTPPYCLEHGGSVLNAAVKLNGQYPIQVIGKLHPEPTIKINSIDLGERIIISEMAEMLSYQDPTNWTALPKAAFVVTGIIPEYTKLSLQEILKKLGCGIDLTLFSAVPSGSGLGTSSILGSAIIACLSRILGQELTQEDLFNRTLYMEQLMTTGGGWQDQIGGVVGGVKHIQTEPGLFQVPRISWTDLKVRPDMDLSERLLLYYTGLRRMAKNILRSIVGRYLDRDPVTLETIHQLRGKSWEMKEQLDHRDIDAFGKNIAKVWELNKTLDPGTSNEEIEAILSKISHLVHGAKLLGAGGGGFLFMVTKGISETRKVKQILTDEPPNSRARFFDFDIDPDGLKVSVL